MERTKSRTISSNTSPSLGPHSEKPLRDSTKNIRLIEILPGDRDATICCKFHVYPVTECPKFVALSYTWGPAQPVHHIQLDGKQFQIRENLWEALRSIRERDMSLTEEGASQEIGTRPHSNMFGVGNVPMASSKDENENNLYWVDQICVDQHNIFERNHQVSLMKDIYTQAAKVLAWLGVSDDENAEFAAINFIRNTNYIEYQLSTDLQSRLPSIEAQQGYLIICSRPYWKRIWIVQEILLARLVEIRIGSQSFRMDRFVDGTHMVKHFGMQIMLSPSDPVYQTYQSFFIVFFQTAAKRLIDMRIRIDLRNHISEPVTLWSLLEVCKQQECSDVRDMVFGLLSLVDPNLNKKSQAKADYSKTPQEVCDLALSWVRAQQLNTDPDNLSAISRFLHTAMNLPFDMD